MSNTHNLLEFELKVRKWAHTSCEGVTVVLMGDPFENPSSITIRNLLKLLELRKKYAQEYLKTGVEHEELRKNILESISYVNKNIKELLAL